MIAVTRDDRISNLRRRKFFREKTMTRYSQVIREIENLAKKYHKWNEC